MSATAPHWQSGTRPAGRQVIPPRKVWARMWTIDADGDKVGGFTCEVDGPHDIDYAGRIRPGRGAVWFRAVRLPYDPKDNGTRWVGPIDLDPAEPTYFAHHLMDHQGGIAGHGYGVEIRSTLGCVVDQFYLKLDPRR